MVVKRVKIGRVYGVALGLEEGGKSLMKEKELSIEKERNSMCKSNRLGGWATIVEVDSFC